METSIGATSQRRRRKSRRRRRRRSSSLEEVLTLSGLGQPNGNGSAEMGLAILSALSVAGIHAAIAPSYFTFASFARKPEEKQLGKTTLFISLGAGLMASVGLYFVFKKWLPAVVSGVTALTLFGIGMAALHSNGVENPSMELEKEMERSTKAMIEQETRPTIQEFEKAEKP